MTKTFYSLNSLELALNFAKDSAKKCFIPDFFRHQDFVHNSKRILQDISFKLKNREYRPHQILTIDIPKSGLTTRPGSIIEFADLVVLFATICSFIEKLDSKLPDDNVYSQRLNPNYKKPNESLFKNWEISLLPIEQRKEIRRFEEWYEAWPVFYEKTKTLIDSGKYKYLVVSDITSYFENINHEVLRNNLEKWHRQCYEINLLMEFLREWTIPLSDGYKINRGIPQGNDISSFLGNIYLLPLDKELVKMEKNHGIKYIRYMDDIKIFAKEHSDAKKALFKMNEVLRGLQLNIQGAKTDIYSKDEFHKFVASEGFDKLNNLVSHILEKENKKDGEREFWKSIPSYLEKLKDFSLKLGKGRIPKEKIRYFKRLITGFTHISKPDLTYRCFNAIEDNPILTDKIVKYFKTFPSGDKIPMRIFGLIKSNEIFDYQISRLIEVYWHKKEIPSGLVRLLLRFATNRALNWAIRMNSLITLSFFELNREQRNKIHKLLIGESNFKVKKAILLCLLQAPKLVRDKILEETLCDIDYRVSLFSRFLRNICFDRSTQEYELKNLDRIDTRLFIEESYKIFLLRESKDIYVLDRLNKILKKRKLKKSYFPYHVRKRIASSYQFIKRKKIYLHKKFEPRLTTKFI